MSKFRCSRRTHRPWNVDFHWMLRAHGSDHVDIDYKGMQGLICNDKPQVAIIYSGCQTISMCTYNIQWKSTFHGRRAQVFSTVSDWQSPDQFQIMIHNKSHLSQQSAPDQANTMVFQVCADQKSVDSLIIPSACAKTNILPTVAMASAWYGEGKEIGRASCRERVCQY